MIIMLTCFDNNKNLFVNSDYIALIMPLDELAGIEARTKVLLKNGETVLVRETAEDIFRASPVSFTGSTEGDTDDDGSTEGDTDDDIIFRRTAYVCSGKVTRCRIDVLR